MSLMHMSFHDQGIYQQMDTNHIVLDEVISLWHLPTKPPVLCPLRHENKVHALGRCCPANSGCDKKPQGQVCRCNLSVHADTPFPWLLTKMATFNHHFLYMLHLLFHSYVHPEPDTHCIDVINTSEGCLTCKLGDHMYLVMMVAALPGALEHARDPTAQNNVDG
jgi:hypothetical protein